MRIPFDKPTQTGTELKYIADVIAKGIELGQGEYTNRAERWLAGHYGTENVMLTFSGTTALEAMFTLAKLAEGDEVILPSYAFPSCANAILRAGGVPVLADISPVSLGLSPESVLNAISPRTKAILALHYAGLPAEIEALAGIARERKIILCEDAAQAFLSSLSGRPLGSFGAMAILSFSTKKNIQCGQGGALILNDPSYLEAAELLRDRGTNRAAFFSGRVKEYSWQAAGTSFSPSEINAAFLCAQLEACREIVARLNTLYLRYEKQLLPLAENGLLKLPVLDARVDHNASIFYVLTRNIQERDKLLSDLNRRQVAAQFHFVPLHLGPGSALARIPAYPTESQRIYERLVRLPLFYSMRDDEVDYVCEKVLESYRN